MRVFIIQTALGTGPRKAEGQPRWRQDSEASQSGDATTAQSLKSRGQRFSPLRCSQLLFWTHSLALTAKCKIIHSVSCKNGLS